MPLFLLTALTMLAFAANSVLNRLAVGGGEIPPLEFALIRLLAGAAMLGLLLGVRGRLRWTGARGRALPVASLLAYLIGFSLAYLHLGAGVGALILFGVVQITMFAGALVAKEVLPLARWAGASLAFLGLIALLWPGEGGGTSLEAALWMAFAGVGWGLYSLAGQGEADPVQATAWNFLLAVSPGVLLLAGFVDLAAVSREGLLLALIAGAVTSGLGYALWYAVVPALGASRAAVAQLTVPVIAAGMGALFLSEEIGPRVVLAAALVLSGVAIASRQRSA